MRCGYAPESLEVSSIPQFARPEEIDLDNPPKKRLDDFWTRGRKSGYREIIDGLPLIETLDIDLARSKCPYFDLFVDDLLATTR